MGLMDRRLNQSETCSIDTAVLLTSSDVFPDNQRRGQVPDDQRRGQVEAIGSPSSVDALTRIGGLTLFQRTIFTLQRGGISRILILAGKEEQSLRSLMDGDDRVHAAICWLPVGEFPPSDSQTWNALANDVQGSCLILSCYAVFSPLLIESLREKCRSGGVVVAAWRNAGHDLVPSADLVVLPVRWFRKSGEGVASEFGSIRWALEQAAAEGAVHVVSVASHEYQDVRGPGGLRQAERTLFRSLDNVQGSLNGFVDRHVNRKLSRVFTPFFLQLGFSPHAVTMVSMVIGLMGAACFALGSYQWGILGALLFQLAVILDCCDGEVARLLFAESPFGQTLDIVADNVVHVGIFAGIAWGAFLENPWHDGRLPLMLGTLAVISNGIALWCVSRVRSLKADPVKWQRLRDTHRIRFDFILDHVANRDFSVIVFVCACLGVLPWFLWLAAVGSTCFAVILTWSIRQSPLSRRS